MIRIAEKDTFHIMTALCVYTIIHLKHHYIFLNQRLGQIQLVSGIHKLDWLKPNPRQRQVVNNTSKPCPHLHYPWSSLSAHINNPKHCSEGQPLTFDPCINPGDLEKGEERVLLYCAVFGAVPFSHEKALIGLRHSPHTNTHHLYVSALCLLVGTIRVAQPKRLHWLVVQVSDLWPPTTPTSRDRSSVPKLLTKEIQPGLTLQIHSLTLTFTRVCEQYRENRSILPEQYSFSQN